MRGAPDPGRALRAATAAPRALVFDFDGVLVESLDIKTRAFGELFRQRPEWVDAIVRLHRENPGMSRYEKFRRIYRDMFREPLTDARMAELDRAFSALVLEAVTRCPAVPGLMEFLRGQGGRRPLFVASATPEEEIRAIVRARGLAPYFTAVHGSPRSKREILAAILLEHGLAPGEVVFVGDALADHEAASALRIAFVGRAPAGGPNPFAGLPAVPVVADLFGLQRWLAANGAETGPGPAGGSAGGDR